MSQDLGNVAAGFQNNFAYGTLTLSNNTYVQLVDNATNSPGTGARHFTSMPLLCQPGAPSI